MRVLGIFTAITLVLAACSSPATTQITAPEPVATATQQGESPTEQPTVAPAATPRPTDPPAETDPPQPPPQPSPQPEVAAAMSPSGAGDAQAIQFALDNVADNGELRLGPGRFQIDQTLIVRLDVTIVGAGSDQTVLEQSDDAAIINARRASLGLQDVALVSTFETEADSRVPLLEIINAQVDIARISIEDAPGTAAWIENSGGTVADSTFTNSGWIGVWVVGTSDVSITGSTVSRNGDGFLFDDDSAPRVVDNTATLNTGAGFWWHGEAGGEASDNVATQNDLGYLVDGNASPELVANTAEGNAEIGFAFRENATPYVDSNQARDSTQGFYVDGAAAPTLIDNGAYDNAEVGVAWYDESAGSADDMLFDNNGQDTFVEETASPTIDGTGGTSGSAEQPAEASPTTTPADRPAEPSGEPGCPSGFTLEEAARCVRVIGSAQLACPDGVLQSSSCVVLTSAVADQTCTEPYLLYRAEPGDPTLPGLDGTCAWFDNGGVCPAGDTYNPDAGGGEIFTHKCKRPPMVTYACDGGTLVGDSCEFRGTPVRTCAVGTLRDGDCIETTSPA